MGSPRPILEGPNSILGGPRCNWVCPPGGVLCATGCVSEVCDRCVSPGGVLYPFGPGVGDEATHHEDDGTSPEIFLQENFSFFGRAYRSLYVGHVTGRTWGRWHLVGDTGGG